MGSEVRAEAKVSQLSKTQIWSDTVHFKSSNGFRLSEQKVQTAPPVNKALGDLSLPTVPRPTQNLFPRPAEQLGVPE